MGQIGIQTVGYSRKSRLKTVDLAFTMGTSSSSGGPKKAAPLLPPWAVGGDGNNNPDVPPADNSPTPPTPPPLPNGAPIVPNAPQSNLPLPMTGSWRGPKSTMGRIATGRSTIRRAGRSYVRNFGGAHQASISAKSGKRAILGLGGFLSSVSGQGFEPALREYGLADCIGQPAQTVFARIADKIAPPGRTIDEVHAREAVLRALETVWERYEEEGRDLATLDHLTQADIREAVIEGIAAYIYSRWLYETGLAIQSKEVSLGAVADVERDAKDFVLEAVRHDFNHIDVVSTNFNTPESTHRMNLIFESAYAFIERQP